jgi:polyisoprenoid-binding protein YceI
MKSINRIVFVVTTFLCVSATYINSNVYTLSKDYAVIIHGTSNLHNWDETVGTVTGSGTVSRNEDKSFNLDALSINMEVRSIKSSEGAIMNNNTYKALKADANPEITIKLLNPIKAIQSQSNDATVSASAELTIAGVTKTITIQVKVFMQDQGKLIFEGSQAIDMTEYGIKPPTALFGALKTGNEITIKFKTSFTTTNN